MKKTLNAEINSIGETIGFLKKGTDMLNCSERVNEKIYRFFSGTKALS